MERPKACGEHAIQVITKEININKRPNDDATSFAIIYILIRNSRWLIFLLCLTYIIKILNQFLDKRNEINCLKKIGKTKK
jgi:hypothetical protein